MKSELLPIWNTSASWGNGYLEKTQQFTFTGKLCALMAVKFVWIFWIIYFWISWILKSHEFFVQGGSNYWRTLKFIVHDYEIEVQLFERVIGDVSVTGKTRTPPIGGWN